MEITVQTFCQIRWQGVEPGLQEYEGFREMFLDRLGVSRQIILQVHELRHDESPCSEQDAQNDEQEEQNGYCRGKWFREPSAVQKFGERLDNQENEER